jgi:L-alanine-DL-glutamate epimerase-like enolase superfamily enzyme
MTNTNPRDFSRRQFLGLAAGAALGTGFLGRYHELAAAEVNHAKIRDVQVMLMQGGRTYTLIKVTADDGLYGIAEAYGSPGVGVKEQVLNLREWLIGKDPLQIDTLYTLMGDRSPSLSGTRTDGSAHNLIRAVSGIEMALWDLAGKILNTPTTTLLGG